MKLSTEDLVLSPEEICGLREKAAKRNMNAETLLVCAAAHKAAYGIQQVVEQLSEVILLETIVALRKAEKGEGNVDCGSR